MSTAAGHLVEPPKRPPRGTVVATDDLVTTLLQQLEAANARIVELSRLVAEMRRGGYDPPPATVEAQSAPGLPEPVLDAITSRALERQARTYLIDYAERRLRETQGDVDLVAKEILEGDSV